MGLLLLLGKQLAMLTNLSMWSLRMLWGVPQGQEQHEEPGLPQGGVDPPPPLPHLWVEQGSLLKCKGCLISCGASNHRLAELRPCSRVAAVPEGEADRLLPVEGPLCLNVNANVHSSHRLWHRRGVVWCKRCGGYATSAKAKTLLKECEPPRAAGLEALQRTVAGSTPHFRCAWQW